jgi:hypothetical protein
MLFVLRKLYSWHLTSCISHQNSLTHSQWSLKWKCDSVFNCSCMGVLSFFFNLANITAVQISLYTICYKPLCLKLHKLLVDKIPLLALLHRPCNSVTRQLADTTTAFACFIKYFAYMVNWVNCSLWKMYESNLGKLIQIYVAHTFCGAPLKCAMESDAIVSEEILLYSYCVIVSLKMKELCC